MRISIAQINPTVGDLTGNAKKIAGYLEKARKVQADLVIFPELAVCGYPPEDLLYKQHFVHDNLAALKSLAPKTSDLTAIIGFVDKGKKGELFNAAAILHDGKLKDVCHKEQLPNYGVFDEKRYFTPGKNEKVFALGKTIFGVNICEDIWIHDGLYLRQAKAGARILINISASPYYEGKLEVRKKMLKSRALETKSFICYANIVGGQDELVFDGASLIFDPQGRLLAAGKEFDEDLLVADLEIARAKKKNAKTAILSLRAGTAAKIPLTAQKAKPLTRLEGVYRALVLGTRDYVKKNGFKKVLVGLSGGIDSSLVALIASDAIGRENVVGISMPSRFSSKGTRSDAKSVAQNLGIKYLEVPIEEIFNAYLATLKEPFAGYPSNVAEENLQARIRGNLLMGFSNKFEWLVLTTGNKSEIAVGYCTLYGDMSGGFAVIKDVPKTKVYELAKMRNNEEGGRLIPESVFTRAPTAELKENQTDQDSLPPYEDLDEMLKAYVEEHRSFVDISKKKFTGDIVKKVITMVDRSEYKRRQSPPGVKITPRAFGKDWRLPITNKYKEF